MAEERILVVDDEPDVLSILVHQLSREGFQVSTAANGESAVAAATADPPDLVVLDLMLPEVDGYEVLRILRRDERTALVPVLLLTARREEEERVRGFEYEADDYVTKPVSTRVLGLRIRALLRRNRAEPVSQSRTLRVGNVLLDRDSGCAYAEGEEMGLTPLEYRLLEVFLERRGRVQTRRQLLQAAWNTEAQIETRTVDMHVARLRAKLGSAGALLETVRGVGYRFRGAD
jgi:two-component system phosphate regulon response regulator PhoB